MIDANTNAIWLGLENTAIYRSMDDGVNFSSQGRGPARRGFSDFALANGYLFETGAINTMDRTLVSSINMLMPPTTTTVTLANAPSPNGSRAVTADTAGNSYIATANAGVTVQRVLFNAMAPEAPRMLSANGFSPSIAALPRNRGVFGAFSTFPQPIQAYVLTY